MTSQKEMQMLTEMEIDIIGEVMNISMGSAATALSTMLGKKVGITTPLIQCIAANDFEFSYLEPVIGVLIKYVEGIEGTNILLLREEDLKKILGHLLVMDPSEIIEMDEISMSAVCEIMNQMMGSAAGALASFLGHPINISPPEILRETNNVTKLFPIKGDSLVSIKFNLTIEGLVESEFISAMDPELAKEIAKKSIGVSNMDADISFTNEVPLPAPQQQPFVYNEVAQKNVSIQHPQALKEPVHATPYNFKPFGGASIETDTDKNNLDLLMSVPIQITVELGRTNKKIKDIADLTIGNIVELNRQAGDQVDVMANGRLIAKGDVVVVDDNYSVRITEIVRANP